jgi:hypothetical protein
MTLSASAQDVPSSSGSVIQGINDIQSQLIQMQDRLDTLEVKVDALSNQ